MKQLRNLRRMSVVSMVLLLAIIVSACAAPAPAGPAAAPAPAAAAREGKDLKIIYWQAPTILNPHQSTGTKDFDAASVMLEPLAHYNQNDELVPALAAEIPTNENGGVAADGTSITWKLKSGIKWSDGSDLTADDVIFTWQYCSDPATACVNKTSFDLVDTVEAVDPTTVKITWKAPNAYPYTTYVSYSGMIIQKKQFGDCVGAAAITEAACQAANMAPIGTNAWKLKEFKPGDVVVYERNENYRDAANVYFDTVEIKGGGDATSAARAVCETGEVDYSWNLQIQKAVLEPILAAGMCDAVAGGSFGIERIVLNFSNPDPALGDKRSEPDQPHPFLTDLNVRKALAMAIDRQSIADQLYGPTGSPTCGIVAAPANLQSPNLKCDRDVEGAKKLLADAGWADTDGDGLVDKDGKAMVISYQTSINPLRQGEQSIVKANLAEIGVKVDLKAIDAGVFFSGDPGNPDTLNKFFADFQMFTNSPDSPDPTNYFGGWTCAKVNSKENSWQGGNDGRYCNKDFDALYDTYTKEMDQAKRVEIAIKLNEMLVDDVAIIPLINRVTPSAKTKSLIGPTYVTFDGNLWNIATWKR